MVPVINLRHEPKLREAFEYAHVHDNTVLIDRRTKWGNPFRIGPGQNREQAITRYRVDLWRRIRSGEIALEELADLASSWLACHCYPENRCHGDPLLDLVMAAPEAHPNAEERRLLYVALTRARRQAYLLAEGGSPSAFVTELIDDEYDVTVFGRPPEGDVPCPQCKEGRVERREMPGTGPSSTAARTGPIASTGAPVPEMRIRPAGQVG